ncbi:MAG TPA: complex I NDUFA9 subunit family protein [Sphingomicrobium sp.]|nr:complex I NDUFA9 subunit family protein [Sphingomicrobium sp.]
MYDRKSGLVTVFGGGGFIGRYVCEALFKTGVRVRVAERNPRRAFFLQPLAAIGQLDLVRADVTQRESVARAVEGAGAVINLVGILDGAFKAVHVDGAANIAEEAKRAGASALVHISAIGADPESPSRYGASKGQAEAKVRAAFRGATIVRPSLLFGQEDRLTNRFAKLMSLLPVYPVIAPRTRFQPVYVRDLARAIAAAALDPRTHAGRSYEIAGPEVMSMRQLTEAIAHLSGQSPMLVDMPNVVAEALSYLGFLPGAPLTRDQWIMLQSDNVAALKSAGLDAFGIPPTPLAAVAPEWLVRFREGGRFAARRESSVA